MYKSLPIFIVAFALAPQIGLAQKPAVERSSIVTSRPGRAAIVTTEEITATVVAIDEATRTVTLKVPKGKTLDVVAGDEVQKLDQIRVGDRVVAQYKQALSLELRKTKVSGGTTETAAMARTKPGERPGGAAGREITVLADVIAVDPKKSTITLKGPRGNVMDLKVQNPDQFKVVKVGDQVEAVYSEALAVAVTPAPKVTGKK